MTNSNPIEQLTSLFSSFPGIGPRQARRFTYYLLRKNVNFRSQLTDLITSLGKNVRVCKESFQHFYTTTKESLSPIERDSNRDRDLLMIVERESDLESIEKSRVYNGRYFVLGGNVPAMEKDPQKYIRLHELKKRVERGKKANELSEIIIATSATPDGDNTQGHVLKTLSPLLEDTDIKTSTLGRGLSTGTELEYIDVDTMKEALENRK
ncbi:MAG: toprim domain-containing protein [Candidatus Paceibacterota bacterium]